MKFNYQSEKRKYIKMWEQLENEYRNAGMSEEAIKSMKQFDWEMLKKERVFCRHNQYLNSLPFMNEDEKEPGKDPLLRKFADRVSYTEKYFQNGRYDWIEKIENTMLVKKVKSLDIMEKEILTMYVFEEKSQTEIAEIMNVTQSSVSRRLRAIKRKLK